MIVVICFSLLMRVFCEAPDVRERNHEIGRAFRRKQATPRFEMKHVLQLGI